MDVDVVAPVFQSLPWLVAGGAIVMVVNLGALVTLLRGKRLVALTQGLGPALLGCGVVAGAMAGLVDPNFFDGTMSALLLRLSGGMAMVVAVGMTLLPLAALALYRRSVTLGWAAVFLALAGLVGALTLLEGVVGGNLTFGIVRAVVFTALGLLAVPALASREGDTALMAAYGMTFLVACVEGASRALVGVVALQVTVGQLQGEVRKEAIAQMLELVEGEIPWGLAAVACATLFPVLALVRLRMCRQLGPWQLGSVVLLALVPVVYGMGLPRLAQLQAAALAAP